MEGNNIKILLVEDDQALSFIVKDNLAQKEFEVNIAEDGLKALELYNSNKYSVIILDIMLPKKDGFTVAREIREIDQSTPIIFLTARSMTEDKIKGLTIGGDDYITKPFSMEELLLKIRIFLKRSHAYLPSDENNAPVEISIGKYIFKPEELLLIFNNIPKSLTLKEAELISFFSGNPNKILGRSEILKRIWGSDDYFLGRSLDVFISRLRKYFKNDPDIKIVNVHGIGFRFNIKK
ncbi:MAG: response regulator transcription factor [Prolixibacteraceae bacterium]|nr:response regulator transcription factor [Prolixibacteraceae bacterium]MBN2774333.1 response regulator transcription factor [Prolixibacteraceae bacterium]